MEEKDDEDSSKSLNIAFISSYPPKKCGIGTFTYDLANSIDKINDNYEYSIVAVDSDDSLKYSDEVEFRIKKQRKIDYLRAAEHINTSNVNFVSIQHEYGIFGGPQGKYLEITLRKLKKPVITTFHTVLEHPNDEMKTRTQNIINLSDGIVVISNTAKKFLLNLYDVPPNKIKVIHHGVPDVPFIDSNFYKDKFDVEGKTVLLTFGLLSPNKGIEVALKALPKVVEKHPEVVYIILGVTHPEVKKNYGEEYRIGLQKLVRDLKLQDNVIFINRYTKIKELKEFLGASDIYITPYCNKEQISSGTLAYAVGAGKAVVSTPYFYAEELLSEGRGVLFDFNDSKYLEQELIKLLDDDTLRNRMRKKAYEFGRDMVWRKVGEEYAQRFMDIQKCFMESSSKKKFISKNLLDEIPDLSLIHLKRITDDCGLIQHTVHTIPDRHHGYSSDDAGRALPLVLKHYMDYEDKSALRMARKYLAFLYHAQRQEDGLFRNFMSYDRKFLEELGGEDTQGRVLWGLGYAVYAGSIESITHMAKKMMDKSLEHLELQYPQAKAYTICGLYYYLLRFSGAEIVKAQLETYADDLVELYKKNSTSDWRWITDCMTYGLAKIPHALFLAYEIMPKEEYKKTALELLEFITEVCNVNKGMLDMVGSDGWYPKGGEKAKFIQQPIEAWYFMEAYDKAYEITADKKFEKYLTICYEWFLGNNIAQFKMGNTISGSCFDGILSDGINPNRGAESTLAFLYAVQIMSNFKISESSEMKNGH